MGFTLGFANVAAKLSEFKLLKKNYPLFLVIGSEIFPNFIAQYPLQVIFDPIDHDFYYFRRHRGKC